MSLDKIAHLMAGFIITLCVGICAVNILLGVVVAFFAGSLKEIYDYLDTDGGTFDFLDLVTIIFGAILAYIYYTYCVL